MNSMRMIFGLCLTVCAVLLFARPVAADGHAVYRVYVGTYTAQDGSKGIYRFDLNIKTGKASEPMLAAEAINPSFLAIHPSGGYLYATGEIPGTDRKPGPSVSAFAIDAATGDLKPLNMQPSGGAGPCHVAVDHTGKTVLVANYGGGSLSALPIQPDGSLGEAGSFIQHGPGSGVNARRQEKPHAHWVGVSPDNRFALCADLGQDKVQVYDFDAAKAKLAVGDSQAGVVPPGGGPRHFAFHPSQPYAYTNNEMTSAVTAFNWNAQTGSLTPIHTVTTLPDGYDGTNNSTAQIVTHPSGRFLYVSNRGHNSVAAFSIDQSTGKLTPIGHTPSGGEIPRNFNITPDGRWLVTANQQTGNLFIFAIDGDTGALKDTGQELKIPRPVCVQFWKVE